MPRGKRRKSGATMHVTQRLRALRERSGLSMAEVAREIGFKAQSSYQRYEDDTLYRRDWLDPELVEKLRKTLVGKGDPAITNDDISALSHPALSRDFLENSGRRSEDSGSKTPDTGSYVQELLGPYAYAQPVNEVAAGEQGRSNGEVIPGAAVFSRRIPVYGKAIGGVDGQFVLNGNKVADVLAPPSLASVPDAYGVMVAGDSMEPRYEAGEVVFADPRIPVRRDHYVIAQIAFDEHEPPHAYVKRFVKLTGEKLVLEQFNPPKTLEFRADQVVSIHRIVGTGAMLG
jgi:phage repressor protein C with HTH and peptisase S24 domain